MTSALVASASVHTTAAACDYLGSRLGTDDAVVILGVVEPGLSERDLGDAANVARTRLEEPAVETAVRDGTPAEEILTSAAERDVDQLVVGATRGDPDATVDPPGSTVERVLAASEWPVTVLPSPVP